jgi:hypothetical protein
LSNAKNAKKKKNSNSLTCPFVGTSVFIRLDRQKNEAKKNKGFFSSAHHNTARDKKELIFSLHLFLLLPNKTYLFDQLTEKKEVLKKLFFK